MILIEFACIFSDNLNYIEVEKSLILKDHNLLIINTMGQEICVFLFSLTALPVLYTMNNVPAYQE